MNFERVSLRVSRRVSRRVSNKRPPAHSMSQPNRFGTFAEFSSNALAAMERSIEKNKATIEKYNEIMERTVRLVVQRDHSFNESKK
jgi:hypothetical protein